MTVSVGRDRASYCRFQFPATGNLDQQKFPRQELGSSFLSDPELGRHPLIIERQSFVPGAAVAGSEINSVRNTSNDIRY